VFVRLFGAFACGQMIAFAVGNGGVSVGRKVVKFCSSIVDTLWHGVLLACWMLLPGAIRFCQRG
jgi:hypothetical protein